MDRIGCGEELREFVAPLIADGWVTYFAPYEAVHKGNIAATLAAYGA